MYNSEDLNKLMEMVVGQLNEQGDLITDYKTIPNKKPSPITPSQFLVIIGLLFGTLSVNSVLVDKEQNVNIVLAGTLRRPTEMETILDNMGNLSFDQVMRALLKRFS